MQWWQPLALFALFAVVSARDMPTTDDYTTSTRWQCSLHRMGLTPECPAKSCKQILEFNPFVNNGKFWFWVPSEEVVFPAFCDMKSGGFMLTINIPKGFVPQTRKSNAIKEIVMKPRTFTDILDSVIEMNEGHLDRIMDPKFDMAIPYKNRVWRFWDKFDIERIRVVLKKDRKIAKVLEFNVKDATPLNWFSFDHLLKTTEYPTWMDLSSVIMNLKFPQFHYRNFNVLSRHVTCTNTWGWMIGVNNVNAITENVTPSPCSWELKTPGLHILYSKLHTQADFNKLDQIDVADSIAIMVR